MVTMEAFSLKGQLGMNGIVWELVLILWLWHRFPTWYNMENILTYHLICLAFKTYMNMRNWKTCIVQ